ncbi:MAG TPA: helix-turn-helix domain-containing protein [Anaerolineales bacterium]
MKRQYFKGEELAALLHVSRSYAYLLMERGDIPTVRFGRSIRISREDLLHYLKKNAPRHLAEEALRALEKGAGDE